MPNGEIQPEFKERLDSVGKWMAVYSESIYNTKGGYLKPQPWGAITEKEGKMFVHLLKKDVPSVTLENFPYKKITNAYLLKDKTKVQTDFKNRAVTITAPAGNNTDPDVVIVLETK